MNSTSDQNDLSLRVGDTDSHGEKVARVFDRVDQKYAIYETESGSLKCCDAGIQLTRDERIDRALIAIGDLITVDPKLGRKYNSLRALGITYWCRDDRPAAARVLEQTHEALRRVFGRRARLYYISGSSVVAILVLIASAMLSRFLPGLLVWSLVALFGALGAFVAAAIRTNPPSMDVLEDLNATIGYGVTRSAVAIIFAIVMYLLVLGGVLLPELARESTFRLLVLAFVAGFSEKLVPEAVIHQAIGGGPHK